MTRVSHFGARGRGGWIMLMLAAVVAGAALLPFLPLSQDIETLLPDGRGEVAADFRLLQQAPFTRKAVIQLTAADGVDTPALLQATDALRDALSPELFRDVVTGPVAGDGGGALVGWLGAQLPHLFTAADAEALSALDDTALQARMQQNVETMVSPQGWWIKGLLRRDPLGLHQQVLQRFRHLNPLPLAKIEANHFVGADGRHALILADVRVPMTDALGANQVLAHFAELQRQLPPGVTASLLSGHRYTAANAGVIRADLQRILLVSLGGILGLFLLFLRHLRALYVFAIPCAVVGLAAGMVALVYGTVSGITVGFGAVLLGITVDYGLHVYLALRHEDGPPAATLARVARPVLFGGLTTLGAFAVLLTSELPGQRQLAVFAISGILLALLLALTVLPHLCGGYAGPLRACYSCPRPPRRLVLLLWGALLLAAVTQLPQVRIDGRLSSLGYVPADLQAAEQQLKTVWGDVRGKALLFAGGATIEQALRVNDELYRRLQTAGVPDVVSLAPLLPSTQTQEENRQRWQDFWQGPGAKLLQATERAAAAAGFSASAFAPFRASLTQEPAPIAPEALATVGLGALADGLILPQHDGVQVISLVPDDPALLAQLTELLPPSVHLVSQSRFAAEVGQAIRADFLRFLGLAFVAVVAALLLLFRRPGPALLALLPVVSGLLVMFGVMGACGLALNLFNIVATVLVIGLGVDYGIFMVCRETAAATDVTVRAVLISGLTTLAGFGALVLARHPAMFSIGLTVLLGIGTAIPTALWVLPALRGEDQCGRS